MPARKPQGAPGRDPSVGQDLRVVLRAKKRLAGLIARLVRTRLLRTSPRTATRALERRRALLGGDAGAPLDAIDRR